MTRANWMMTIPVSSLAPLLYHSLPPRMPYFCLLTPISPVQRHFNGMKYTFLTILHITRETKSRASWITIVPSSSQRQSRITNLISRVIYHSLPFFVVEHNVWWLEGFFIIPAPAAAKSLEHMLYPLHQSHRSLQLQIKWTSKTRERSSWKVSEKSILHRWNVAVGVNIWTTFGLQNSQVKVGHTPKGGGERSWGTSRYRRISKWWGTSRDTAVVDMLSKKFPQRQQHWQEEREKRQWLGEQLEGMWGVRTTLVLLVIGAL